MNNPTGLDTAPRRSSDSRGRAVSFLLVACVITVGGWPAVAEPARQTVTLLRTPNGGIQPQALVDASGTTHLIYFQGDPRGGDVCYVRHESGEPEFGKPIRVNSRDGSVMAVGTIRGAQLAIGKNGRVHVAWNGPAPEEGGYLKAPLYYTRLDDSGSAFERERNVITHAYGLDGGSSVAADGQGNVYVTWHVQAGDGSQGEGGRAVFVARSRDEGRTFEREKRAISEPTGACGCCGMKAYADREGRMFALYRGARDLVNRDEILLASKDHGQSFQIVHSDPWVSSTCPMSSASLAELPSSSNTLAAWETGGEVYYVLVDSKTGKVSGPTSPPGRGPRKHPVVVANRAGQILLAWAEGTGWQKGGSVHWQVFDQDGNPTRETGSAEGVPVWSLATAFAREDGGFVIVY